MKVTVTFEQTFDDIGKGWSSVYTYEDVELLEDVLYAFGRSLQCAGFQYVDYLSAELKSGKTIGASL
jgi:hypothetical protein